MKSLILMIQGKHKLSFNPMEILAYEVSLAHKAQISHLCRLVSNNQPTLILNREKFKMGTKQNPGKFDCYSKALPDEPMFVLLARDPEFYELINRWANKRLRDIKCGVRPESDLELVSEAFDCAFEGQEWRKQNNFKWR